jgi:glutamate synthase (NADPH/NADH) small chain
MQRLDASLKQIPMPELPVEERLRTFDEVAMGYSEEQALAEASRCLQCENPLCVEICPLHIDVRSFIKLIRLGDYRAAAEKIREKNCLPSVCGRVCPHEKLCMIGCKNTLGDPINIGALERFISDWELENGATLPDVPSFTGKNIAIVGSGPAGLSVANDLARMGHHVVIFEALHEPGGVLTYGIPEFRLAKKIVKQEIEIIKKLGVDIRTNTIVGKTVTLDELFDEEEFDSVFLGTGSGLPVLLRIPGENLCGVYSLNEFLIRINLMKAYMFPNKSKTPIKVQGKVAILGARGLDAARCALRMRAEEACIFYQRVVVGRVDDIRQGREEGIKFQPLTKPVRLIGDRKHWVKQVELIKLDLGPIGKRGRRRLIPIKGSEFRYNAKTVVIATRHIPNLIAIRDTSRKIIVSKRRTIIVNPVTLEVTQGIYAGGDVVTGAATVIGAIEAGKRAAESINHYLT